MKSPTTGGLVLFGSLTLLGLVSIGLGYRVVAGTAMLAKQTPAVVSGGIAGLALVVVGGVLLTLQLERRAVAARRREQAELLVALRAVVDLAEAGAR